MKEGRQHSLPQSSHTCQPQKKKCSSNFSLNTFTSISSTLKDTNQLTLHRDITIQYRKCDVIIIFSNFKEHYIF